MSRLHLTILPATFLVLQLAYTGCAPLDPSFVLLDGESPKLMAGGTSADPGDMEHVHEDGMVHMHEDVTVHVHEDGMAHVHGDGAAGMAGGSIPKDLDTNTIQVTDDGYFIIGLKPDTEEIPLNQMHAWILTVATADGRPVDEAEISIDGGMPQHGHGLPTSPQVTENLGLGSFLIEGVRFNMAGWWELGVVVNANGEQDQAVVNLILE